MIEFMYCKMEAVDKYMPCTTSVMDGPMKPKVSDGSYSTDDFSNLRDIFQCLHVLMYWVFICISVTNFSNIGTQMNILNRIPNTTIGIQ